MKKLSLIIVFVLVIVLGFYVNKNLTKNPQIYQTLQNPPQASIYEPIEVNKEKNISESYAIKNFPFQTQAPHANWDELHEEACEEASLALVYYYLKNLPIKADQMEQEIQKLYTFQLEKYKEHRNLTLEEVSYLSKNIYNLDSQIVKNITLSDLKKTIFESGPVIVPTSGKDLKNPNFKNGGPLYHMVVAIGYSPDTIIVQDVGTRKGNYYIYNDLLFYDAIHDWPGNENIKSGQKNILKFD